MAGGYVTSRPPRRSAEGSGHKLVDGVDGLPVLAISGIVGAPHGDEKGDGKTNLNSDISQARVQGGGSFFLQLARIVFDIIQLLLFFFHRFLIGGAP